MSASTITWFDDEGFGTLSNGKPAPGDRFGLWKPDRQPIGPVVTGLGTGRIYRFEFRRDDIVSFEIAAIPSSQLSLLRRLKYHLMNGGLVQLNGDRELIEDFATCTLAPDTTPDYEMSDRQTLEYTFSATLRSAAAGSGDVISPVLPSLVLWLNPESLASGGAVDAGTVDIWPDASGNDNDAVQATSDRRPTYREGVANGWGALEFDWTNTDCMVTPTILNPSDGSTLFIVARRNGVHVEHNNFLGLADSTGEGASNSRIVETNSGDVRDQQYVTYVSGGPISDWYASGTSRGLGLSTSWFTLGLSIESSAVIVPYHNSLTAEATFDPDDVIDKDTRIVVGRDNLGTGNTGNNQIAEILLYDDPLPTSDRSNVIRYLTSKYGITLV